MLSGLEFNILICLWFFSTLTFVSLSIYLILSHKNIKILLEKFIKENKNDPKIITIDTNINEAHIDESIELSPRNTLIEIEVPTDTGNSEPDMDAPLNLPKMLPVLKHMKSKSEEKPIILKKELRIKYTPKSQIIGDKLKTFKYTDNEINNNNNNNNIDDETLSNTFITETNKHRKSKTLTKSDIIDNNYNILYHTPSKSNLFDSTLVQTNTQTQITKNVSDINNGNTPELKHQLTTTTITNMDGENGVSGNIHTHTHTHTNTNNTMIGDRIEKIVERLSFSKESNDTEDDRDDIVYDIEFNYEHMNNKDNKKSKKRCKSDLDTIGSKSLSNIVHNIPNIKNGKNNANISKKKSKHRRFAASSADIKVKASKNSVISVNQTKKRKKPKNTAKKAKVIMQKTK